MRRSIKRYYKKAGLILKEWSKVFRVGVVSEKNIKRDIIIISFTIVFSAVFLVASWHSSKQERLQNIQKLEVAKKASEEIIRQDTQERFETENTGVVLAIQEKFDVTPWRDYQSNWYGFKIKYPQDWKMPVVNQRKQGSKAEYRFSFLTNEQENKNFIGFDIAIYNTNKIKELSATDEFPQLKDNQQEDPGKCSTIEGHIIETGDYSAEEIYIPPSDDCYEKTLFFSVIESQYIYNIVPILRTGVEFNGDPMVGVSDDLPEFFSAISQFENIDIVRPKPKPVQPKITAPFPVSYKKDSLGRLVCAKKNDKPSKSDKNKKRHLDMECCLDPDEYPNPHCYYPVEKYGKYLK